ncbi:methyl-accepting chemotaxis sensory transducer with Cache sensor [Geoalkalibacter ferrihydriticus]|uniref:Methyl-accepting chemotaxis sensory transducer with Cache sensor n=1 Tax=Geoalkalibacter ferrihydriticus TaxID=392333 RepID=A0A1G9XMR6_9BACT|nr:methyl-accepting chemotaxis protein [Geoalkalibacter ferrihydriticus]SDM97781.1 methyl-accepting chemotaxis sensory transducer with Cache sensor [Geoalkalibacter ferrihydriticus]
MNITIGQKLTGGIILLLALVSSGIGTMSYYQAATALQEQVEANISLVAKYGGNIIQEVLQKHLTTVSVMAESAEIKSMDWDRQKIALEQQTQMSGYLGMGVISIDGTTRYPDGSTAQLGDRSYTRLALQGTANISDVIISRATNSPVMIVAAPIRKESAKVSGVLLARLDATWLSEVTDGIGYGENGYSYIIDGKGTLIAHSNRDLVLNQTNFIEEAKTKPEYTELAMMFQRMTRGETGFDGYPFMGSERFFGYHPISGTGWSMAVGAHRADVFHLLPAMRMMIIILSLVFTAIGSLLVFLLARSIVKPIIKGVNLTQEIAKGDFSMRLNMDRQDEIGILANALDGMADNLARNAELAEQIADGNLNVEVQLASDKDQLGLALQTMVVNLNDILGQIQVAGEQIASGSGQVADSSQALSQGATESASSLEEISASLNQLSSQTGTNAENANTANQLAAEARNAAQQGSEKMQAMVAAMADINNAGQSISKIIKVIDEIAFQTNLLALNAAVEAARAGQHGKGFAVVAEEVRNLAARSAKAAQETSELIEGSVQKTANGTTIADQTAQALQSIVSGIGKVTDLVAEIAAASSEQAQGVNQINQGITQIDQVTQQNTASAEESAAASEELSGQAEQMRKMLMRFTLKHSSSSHSNVRAVPQKKIVAKKTSWGESGVGRQ